jgi:hypothetical protein
MGRLWNILSRVDEFHMSLQQLEGTHFDPVWCMHPATDPLLSSFTIQVEADDPAVHSASFVVKGAESFESVTLRDVLGAVHRECLSRVGHFARGVEQELC